MTKPSFSYHSVLPHPFLSVIVMLSWLLLMHSVAFVHLLSAVLLGIALPKITQSFIQPVQEKIRWLPVWRLAMVVLYDIIMANIQVALLILGRMDRIHPKWVRVPLDTNHAKTNTLLALIVTTTPGTVSVGLDEVRGSLLVHVLNTQDPDAIIAEIKTRYEQPLMHIFHLPPLGENA